MLRSNYLEILFRYWFLHKPSEAIYVFSLAGFCCHSSYNNSYLYLRLTKQNYAAISWSLTISLPPISSFFSLFFFTTFDYGSSQNTRTYFYTLYILSLPCLLSVSFSLFRNFLLMHRASFTRSILKLSLALNCNCLQIVTIESISIPFFSIRHRFFRRRSGLTRN